MSSAPSWAPQGSAAHRERVLEIRRSTAWISETSWRANGKARCVSRCALRAYAVPRSAARIGRKMQYQGVQAFGWGEQWQTGLNKKKNASLLATCFLQVEGGGQTGSQPTFGWRPHPACGVRGCATWYQQSLVFVASMPAETLSIAPRPSSRKSAPPNPPAMSWSCGLRSTLSQIRIPSHDLISHPRPRVFALWLTAAQAALDCPLRLQPALVPPPSTMTALTLTLVSQL